MAQNEPQRKNTPPCPSPNSPSLLFEYQCRSGKFIRLANRIESKLFRPNCSNWNALLPTGMIRFVQTALAGCRRVQDHYYQCPRFLVACPNRCDAGKIAREDVATHVSQLCPAAVVPCQFREMGCKHVVYVVCRIACI